MRCSALYTLSLHDALPIFVVWKKGLLREGASGWDEAQKAMLQTGWVDNKILSLGDEVYATRYVRRRRPGKRDRKSTRLNSSHITISYAVFCLKKKKKNQNN